VSQAARSGAAGASVPAPPRSPIAESVAARAAGLAAALVDRASPATLLNAASAPTDSAFLGAMADLLLETAYPDSVASARLRGRIALARAIEQAGGLWTADQAQHELGVKRSTLQNWRDDGRVLALAAADGSFLYPIAQFEPPATDLTRPRPFPAIAAITAKASNTLSSEELIALLCVPQPMLSDANDLAISPFDALARGREDSVLAMLDWLREDPDADAPQVARKSFDTMGYAELVRAQQPMRVAERSQTSVADASDE
jgi:hypothetical protein